MDLYYVRPTHQLTVYIVDKAQNKTFWYKIKRLKDIASVF